MSQYSTLDSEFLCGKCTHGQVTESHQGHTHVRCTFGSGQPLEVKFVVTKCSTFQIPEKPRLYGDAWGIRYDEGRLQLQHPEGYDWADYTGDHQAMFHPDGRLRKPEKLKKTRPVVARLKR